MRGRPEKERGPNIREPLSREKQTPEKLNIRKKRETKRERDGRETKTQKSGEKRRKENS